MVNSPGVIPYTHLSANFGNFLWCAKAKIKNNTKLKNNNTKLRDNTKLKKNNTKFKKIILR